MQYEMQFRGNGWKLYDRVVVEITNCMPSPQKAKGSGFEREIASYLSKIYNESFIRAPGSGAYVGGVNQARKQFLHEGQVRNFKGDIVPGQSFPRMNAECKFYSDFPFNLLFGECKQLELWLDQLMAVADPGDFNILFMKFNRKGKFIATTDTNVKTSGNYFKYTSAKHGTWYIQDFDVFWQHNTNIVKQLSGT